MKQKLYFLLGSISLVLAYFGIVMPGFPGTPFILFTAFFYIRSSPRMYRWMLRQRLFARIIHAFEKEETIPMKLKISLLIPFWISLAVAAIWFVKTNSGLLILAATGILASVLFLRLKKLPLNPNEDKPEEE